MSYKKATPVLPKELLKKVQEYVGGECIYIPRTSGNKKKWGATTSTRQELKNRNEDIYRDYLAVELEIKSKYFLPVKVSVLIRDKLHISQKEYIQLVAEGRIKSVPIMRAATALKLAISLLWSENGDIEEPLSLNRYIVLSIDLKRRQIK